MSIVRLSQNPGGFHGNVLVQAAQRSRITSGALTTLAQRAVWCMRCWAAIATSRLRHARLRPGAGILLKMTAMTAPPMPPCTISSSGSTMVLVKFATLVVP